MKHKFILFILIAFFFTNSFADQSDIIVLKSCENATYPEMIEELGPPIDKTGYTIKNAPTKSWNHHELFSKYPKNIKNENIYILEVTWDADDYLIIACYHMVDGENRCLVAKKIKKNIQF